MILSESVTLGNAVSFWKKTDRLFQKQQRSGASFFASAADETTTTTAAVAESSSSSCQAPSNNNNQNPFQFLQRIMANPKVSSSSSFSSSSAGSSSEHHPNNNNDDDDACRNCIRNAESLARMCRGGHVAPTAAAEDPILEATARVVAAAATPSSFFIHPNIPLRTWKVIFQAFLTLLNVACWLIPLRSKKITQNKLGLSLANAFSGGVFLSLAFGHLIPECVHGFDNSYNEATPFLLVLGGYLLIFFFEKVAFDAHEILHEMEHAGETTTAIAEPSNVHHHHQRHSPKSSSSSTSIKKTTTSNGDTLATTTTAAAGSSGRSAIILLGALAVHSILEMMALGLADSWGDCALLTLSISLHQPAESIALLVAFLKSGLTKGQIIRYLSVFSCMGPIGVFLGMLVNEYAAPIVDSVMLAVVAGTFVYVGATEVIPEEWEDGKDKWKKFAALMSGIVSIFAITQYTMTLSH
jgi:zinc transporter 1/2/3